MRWLGEEGKVGKQRRRIGQEMMSNLEKECRSKEARGSDERCSR